ncbi:MAG: hypothetical protein ACYC3X_17660 [Pirellulaceae bacterium]
MTPARRLTLGVNIDLVRGDMWLVPLLGLAAIVAGGSWWMNRPRPALKPATPAAGTARESTPAKSTPEKIAEPAVPGPTMPEPAASGPAASSGTDAGVEALAQTLRNLFDGAGKTLETVTDAATAQAALPKLEAMGTEIDGLAAAFKGLPEPAQPLLKTLVKTSTAVLQEKANKVLGLAGVSDVLKPIVAAMVQKLMALVG